MKMYQIMRSVMLLLCGMTLLGSLASCGSETGSGTSNGPTTLSFWSRDSDAALIKPVVDAYNASHSNRVKLNLIPAGQFVAKFGAAVASGSAPDIVAIDLVYLPAFNAANQMTDITAQAHSLPFFDKLSPSHVRLATYNNKVYGLPFSAEGSFLLYNKDLFKQAGLDVAKPPTSWAEIEAASKKITALGNGIHGYYFSGANGGINAFTFLPYIWASGGDVLNTDGTQATFTDPHVKAALAFYHRLWAEGQIPQSTKVDTGTDWFTGFTAGKVGMVGAGAFELSTLKAKYPNINFGVTPLPGENGGTSSFAGGDTIGIPAGSKHVKEAFDFISWSLSDNVQIDQFAKNGGLPVRTDLASNKYSQQDPRYLTVSQAFAQGRTPYSVHYNQLFNDANSPWLGIIQKAVFDGQIDAAVNMGQQQFSKILSSSGT